MPRRPLSTCYSAVCSEQLMLQVQQTTSAGQGTKIAVQQGCNLTTWFLKVSCKKAVCEEERTLSTPVERPEHARSKLLLAAVCELPPSPPSLLDRTRQASAQTVVVRSTTRTPNKEALAVSCRCESLIVFQRTRKSSQGYKSTINAL